MQTVRLTPEHLAILTADPDEILVASASGRYGELALAVDLEMELDPHAQEIYAAIYGRPWVSVGAITAHDLARDGAVSR